MRRCCDKHAFSLQDLTEDLPAEKPGHLQVVHFQADRAGRIRNELSLKANSISIARATFAATDIANAGAVAAIMAAIGRIRNDNRRKEPNQK